jgi:hypothetical protein
MVTAISEKGVKCNDLQCQVHTVDAVRRSLEPRNVPEKTMSVLHLTTTDPAGAGYNLVQALQRYTCASARIFTSHPNVYGHPEDIGTVYDYYDELEQLLLDADVLHFHKINEDYEIGLPLNSSRKRSWRIKDFLTLRKQKALVYHIHGHPFERKNPVENGKQYSEKKARLLASTPDLEALYKPHCDVEYFPNCVPQDDLLYAPRGTNKMLTDSKGLTRYIVAHTVSVPSLKNVAQIEEAVRYVSRTKPVNYLQLSDMPFDKVMRVKRHSHIIFDHMQGYYGLASLEGFSLGKPVICGINDYNIKAVCNFFGIGDSHPWQIARTLQELKDTLMDLISNPEMMDAVGWQGRQFMENTWSDKNVATRLAQIYSSL